MLPSSRFLSLSRFTSRRCVWHAGFENAKEAQQLALQIEKLLMEAAQGAATASTEEPLRALQQQYERITGERYEPEKN